MGGGCGRLWAAMDVVEKKGNVNFENSWSIAFKCDHVLRSLNELRENFLVFVCDKEPRFNFSCILLRAYHSCTWGIT
ncbi:hypothetical protein BDZ97DRAFT_1857294 [Flammula alnicola]|nr:hypothetical protein BDZ97DRAFT_1857294 [Flammula alnicola]